MCSLVFSMGGSSPLSGFRQAGWRWGLSEAVGPKVNGQIKVRYKNREIRGSHLPDVLNLSELHVFVEWAFPQLLFGYIFVVWAHSRNAPAAPLARENTLPLTQGCESRSSVRVSPSLDVGNPISACRMAVELTCKRYGIPITSSVLLSPSPKQLHHAVDDLEESCDTPLEQRASPKKASHL